MDVAHRGLNIRVTHPRLNGRDLGARNGQRPEHMPEVVKAERTEVGGFQCAVVALRERIAVQVAVFPGEHEVVVGVAVGRRSASALATSGIIGTERTLPDFGVVSVRAA